MKILIVDDDKGFRTMLLELLNPEHDVSLLCDGHNAVALLSDPNHRFDLVILDMRMPRLSGEDVLQTLASWAGVRTRFVVVSGAGNIRRFANLPQVLGVWEKPFDVFEFKAWLEKSVRTPGRTEAPAVAQVA